MQHKSKYRRGNDTLDDTRATHWLKMPPSLAFNAYNASQYGVQLS
jgi:hypothetical protein